jgi:PAS domain S-box-containing protein
LYLNDNHLNLKAMGEKRPSRNRSNSIWRNHELQLHEYQKRISNILESFTDGFFEVDKDWVVTYFNKEAERLLMKDRSEIIGRNLWEAFNEAIPLKFYSEYHRAVTNNISVRFEEYFSPNDLWVEVSAFPSGQGLSVYFKDITDHKKSTEQLLREKQKYTELFNYSPVPQWVFDLETFRFLDVNEAAVKLYGYSREEFLNMTIKEIRPPEDLGALQHILDKHIKVGLSSQSYVRHRKKSGEIVYVLVEGNSINFDGRNARLVMSVDRTKEVMSENAIAESIARFNIVSKATSDAIWDWDMVTGAMVWNQGIKGIFGYRQTTYDENWWRERVHPEDLDRVVGQLTRLIEKKEHNLRVKYRFQCRDGSYRFVLDRAFIVFNDQGVPVRLIGSMQDITDHVNQIKEIEEQNSRLSQISWIQSHKVRGPLARIMGLVSLIDQDVLSTREKPEFITDLKNAAQELDNVVREIVVKT